MHAYEVGKPYHPGRREWPECSEFNYRGGECELKIFFRSPTPREIEAVQAGRSEFALFHQGDQIILCYRFDAADRPGAGVPWSDAPYSFHRLADSGVPEAERALPPDPKAFLDRLAAAGKDAWKAGRLPGEEFTCDSRALLQILLIDAATGIIRCLRAVTLSPEFTRALFGAIRDQAARPWDRAAYERALKSITDHHTSEQLAGLASVRCQGGA
jgi:hypothetical protein